MTSVLPSLQLSLGQPDHIAVLRAEQLVMKQEAEICNNNGLNFKKNLKIPQISFCYSVALGIIQLTFQD